MRARQYAVAAAAWMTAMALAACQGDRPPGDDAPASASVAAEELPAALPEDASALLHQRATQALAEQRMVSPAGHNAVEYYLAARDQDGAGASAQAALVELQPYLLIAAEQALARGDAPEATRLLGLMARIDARAPALPRLQATLARLREQERAAEAAAAIAADNASAPGETQRATASPLPAPVVPVAPAPTPALSPPSTAAAEPRAQSTPAPERTETAVSATPPSTDLPPAREPPPARAAVASIPRLLQDARPRYPLPALRARLEGQAEVAFTIQPDGSVGNVQLLSSSPAGVFDASAMAVAQRWRFEATGQAHRTRRTVLFRLPDGGGGEG